MTTFTCTTADTALLMIDLQERFLPAIPDLAADRPCGRNSVILATAARTLGLPVVISEQYPKGLGRTLPWIAEAATGAAVVEKTAFSCCDEPELARRLERLDRRTVILCGVEAHVCVLSSAADLVARGFTVLVAADAVASRRVEHRDQALTAMRDLGALVLPVETILFRLLRRAGTPEFKVISGLVK